MAAKETQYKTVVMDDGRTVDFPGKRRLMKEGTVSKDGFTIEVRFDIVHGETRTFKIEANDALFARFALHGIEQKIGDEVAGLEDPEDMTLAIDEVIERLQAGNWSAVRESSGLAGTSVLAKALIQSTGKAPQVIKDFLKGKTNAEKLALRQNPKIAPIIAELEAKKKPKAKETVDTDAMLEEIA